MTSGEPSVLCPGDADGEVLALTAPLSFWGGVDAAGTIIDAHHPQRGASVTGRVLVMPAGRGSSSSSSVLAELIRAGRAPAAIVLAEPDVIVVLGAVVAAEVYGIRMPVLRVDKAVLSGLRDGLRVRIRAGALEVDPDAGAGIAPDARAGAAPRAGVAPDAGVAPGAGVTGRGGED